MFDDDNDYNDDDYEYFDETYGVDYNAAYNAAALGEVGGRIDRDVLGEIVQIHDVKRKKEAIRDPLKRFYIYVDSEIRQLNREGLIKVDSQRVLTAIEKIPNYRYLNPAVFVLGYGLTSGGRSMPSKESFDELLVKLKLTERQITPEDILRYCYLWMRLDIIDRI